MEWQCPPRREGEEGGKGKRREGKRERRVGGTCSYCPSTDITTKGKAAYIVDGCPCQQIPYMYTGF